MDYIIQPTDPLKPSFIIKPYTTNGPATPESGGLYPGAVSANTTLVLFGKGDVDYGEPMANNLLHVLENFAGPTVPFYPVQGQLWYHTNIAPPNTLQLYDGASWKEVVVNGALVAPLDVNGFKIVNLLDPTANQDAATKVYVDSAVVAAAGVASFNTRTGPVTLTSLDVTGALGFTPYNATNPAGYVTHAGGANAITPTDIATAESLVLGSIFIGTGPNTGAALAIGANTYILTSDGTTAAWVAPTASGVSSFNTRTGPVTLTSLDVTTALTYTPYDTLVATLTGGSMVGTSLVLNLPYGQPDLTVTNVSPAIHDHSPDEILVNANPIGYDRSRMRDLSINSPAFPQITMLDVLTYYDQDLYALMGRKRRTLFTVIAAQTITNVSTGTPGTWTIAGNYIKEFLADATVTIAGNAGFGVDGNYTVLSSVYLGGNTVITVNTVPGTATISGTIVPVTYALDLDSQFTVEYSDLVVHANGVKLYASERGNSYTIIPGITAGKWCGLYNGTYQFNITVDGAGPTLISITPAQPTYTINGVTPGTDTWTVSGLHSTEFRPNQRLVITGNTGLGANATFTGSIAGTTLTVSGIAGGLISDGLAVLGAYITQNTYIVAQIGPYTGGNGTYTISQSQFISAIPMTTVPLYNVVSATDVGPDTAVVVSQPIAAGATGDGTMYSALLFTQLESLVNAAFVSAVVPALFDADSSLINIFSNTSGNLSAVVYADVSFTSVMGTNLSVTPTTVNRPAVATDLGYKEIGTPFTYSSIIQLDPSVSVGQVIECVCTVG